jgi:phosphoribosyl-ATP pyrophosphohydrolase/phosphoribosyl-AMP cyclohydrolase
MAVELSLETKLAHYYSRSRGTIWRKGETSGNIQHIVDIRHDCDKDALLYIVRQEGPAVHTGCVSCFDVPQTGGIDRAGFAPGEPVRIQDMLTRLQNVVAGRLTTPREGSYTSYLFSSGLDKILKKVGEEATEVVIAAKNRSNKELCGETADLIYHLTVMLTESGLSWDDVRGELGRRYEKKG